MMLFGCFLCWYLTVASRKLIFATHEDIKHNPTMLHMASSSTLTEGKTSSPISHFIILVSWMWLILSFCPVFSLLSVPTCSPPPHPSLPYCLCIRVGNILFRGSILTKTQLVWVCMWAGCSSFIYASPLVRQQSSGADGCSVQLDSAIVKTPNCYLEPKCFINYAKGAVLMHGEPVLLKCNTNQVSAFAALCIREFDLF